MIEKILKSNFTEAYIGRNRNTFDKDMEFIEDYEERGITLNGVMVGDYTEKKNMAFIKALAVKNIKITIIRDLSWYFDNKKKSNLATVVEIIWLVDLKYNFNRNINSTDAIPTQKFNDIEEVQLADYFDENFYDLFPRFLDLQELFKKPNTI
jgi:hypothetical protein